MPAQVSEANMGMPLVSEHVTFKEEDGRAVVWKAAGFKHMLWLHSPATHSSLLPEVFLLYPHSVLWGHRLCWCCRLQGMGLSEAPTCSNPDSVNSSLGGPELCCVALGSSESFT